MGPVVSSLRPRNRNSNAAAAAVIGTQVAVAVTGTNEFGGTTCHSHKNFVYPEHKLTGHYNNRTGVRAMCVDCHVPHNYPAKLIYKAKAVRPKDQADFAATVPLLDAAARRWLADALARAHPGPPRIADPG